MIRRPPRSTRTDTSFPTRRSSDLDDRPAQVVDLIGIVDFAGFEPRDQLDVLRAENAVALDAYPAETGARSEEHTSELQSLMRNSYAVFCLKKKKNKTKHTYKS